MPLTACLLTGNCYATKTSIDPFILPLIFSFLNNYEEWPCWLNSISLPTPPHPPPQDVLQPRILCVHGWSALLTTALSAVLFIVFSILLVGQTKNQYTSFLSLYYVKQFSKTGLLFFLSVVFFFPFKQSIYHSKLMFLM